ncbi:MAG TPA: hypothetical protein PK156_18300 [Polyangium sp.]|nr:hypothetical protein [Polyangium sp.]
MRHDKLFRAGFVMLTLAAAIALPACSKKDEAAKPEITAESAAAEEAITEQHEPATVSWVVAPEGKLKARFKAADGAPLGTSVTGSVTVKPLQADAKPVTAKLVYDTEAGVHTAEFPALNADLTEVSYDVSVKGKPIKGAMHVPRGGTRELVATAKVSAEVKLPEGKKGPNGGVIQVVGDDVIEVVADVKSGETRVYVLDDDFKPIPVGKRKVKLAVVGSAPETVELAAEPKGLYFTGKLTVVKTNPHRLTVVLTGERSPEPVVVLCGYHPGTVVVVGPGAPTIGLFVAVGWAPAVVVVDPTPNIVVVGKGKGKGRWGWKGGKGVHIKIH